MHKQKPGSHLPHKASIQNLAEKYFENGLFFEFSIRLSLGKKKLICHQKYLKVSIIDHKAISTTEFC